MTVKPKRAILIAGPTASGKSEVAIDVAKALDGIIINADSMQVYEELSLLIAKPGKEACQQVPHLLYSVVSMANLFSVADWLALARKEAQNHWNAGKIPIFTGGTGLYFKALLNGLADIPGIPADIRDTLRKRLEKEGLVTLFNELVEKDPEVASRLEPGDKQRILRALEVIEATGTPLSVWQKKQTPPFPDVAFLRICLILEKEKLNQKIRNRFKELIKQGAVEEARAFIKLNIDESLPGTKALGLQPLIRHINGEITLDEAIELAVIETRQYAKRQRTWFRNQFPDWHRVEAGEGTAKTILSLAEKEFRG